MEALIVKSIVADLVSRPFPMSWTLSQAREQFAEMVSRAVTDGPQSLHLDGQEPVVVLSKAQFDQLTKLKSDDLKAALMALNLEGIELERNSSPTRDLES